MTEVTREKNGMAWKSARELAKEVLAESHQTSLHYTTICSRILEKSESTLAKRGGKTPEATVGSLLRSYPETFVRLGRGYYGLRSSIARTLPHRRRGEEAFSRSSFATRSIRGPTLRRSQDSYEAAIQLSLLASCLLVLREYFHSFQECGCKSSCNAAMFDEIPLALP